MIDFKSLTEVLSHVEQVLVIDLLDHAMSLSEECSKGLIAPAKGLYILGSLEPILLESEKYYYKTQIVTAGLKNEIYDFAASPAIKDLSKITKFADDVYDSTGRVVLTSKDIRSKGKFFRNDPGVPSVAIKMAIAMVQRYLGTLCRHTSHIHTNTRVEHLVKDDHQYLIDNDEYLIAFDNLITQINHFVANDQWNIYFYKIKGTSMVILKGVDWRVYRYYELTLTDHDNQQE